MRNKINLCILLIYLFIASITYANTINIPYDYITIQEGINNSITGDTILLSPGTYHEQATISGKSITIGSLYLTTQNDDYINQTIIDGDNNNFVIKIENCPNDETSITGLTIRNSSDGILPYSRFIIDHCNIINCVDGIDYESGSGGSCQNNTFIDNSDDGIDLDGAVDIIIENNSILNNGDDGIEIRLHSYTGNQLNIIIRKNIISGNSEDGIQLIDYDGLSDRIFNLLNNLIEDNSMAGIGCMSDGNTVENYEGASILEPIYLINNTIYGNNYGVTGGDNLTAKNNIVVNCTETAMKNVDNNSLISYCNFWNNGLNFDNCNKDDQTLVLANPLFISSNDFHLQDISPCIRAGTPDECPIRDIEGTKRGNPPDIGAYENISDGDQSLPVELSTFTVQYLDQFPTLYWVTQSETDNLGWNIYRSKTDILEEAIQINTGLIAGAGTTPGPTNYIYKDESELVENTEYWYWLESVDYAGSTDNYGPISLLIPEDGEEPGSHEVPEVYGLLQNYPNPFNSSTEIRFMMKESCIGELAIYNIKGQKIRILFIDKSIPKDELIVYKWNGKYENGKEASTGVYYYRLRTTKKNYIRKMILMK